MIVQDVQVQQRHEARHDGAEYLDLGVSKGLAQRYGCQGKPGVGEDHAPPGEMEVPGRCAQHARQGDREPPQAQAPKRGADDVGHDLDDGLFGDARLSGQDRNGAKADVKVGGDVVGDTDKGEGCKGRWADQDKERRSGFAVGERAGHKAADHVGVYQKADDHAQALA